MNSEKLYTTKEVAEILGIKCNSVTYYHGKYGIGNQADPDKQTSPVLYTDADIEEIRETDGRFK